MGLWSRSGRRAGQGKAVLASRGARRKRPAFPQPSTLAPITAAAFPLVAQCRKLARATLTPRGLQTGDRSACHCPWQSTALPPQPTPADTISIASKKYRTSSQYFFFFYTKTFLLISISDRQQNSGAQRSQVRGGGPTSAWKTRLLKANQATLPPPHTQIHTHSNYFAYFDTILAGKPFFSLLLRNQLFFFKKLAVSLLPKGKKKNLHKVISQYFSNI